MFLVVQHPLADLRGLLGSGCGRLSLPSWPLGNPDKDFVRSSGLVKPRLRGGVADWAGEDLYGDAKNALRFLNWRAHLHLDQPPAEADLECAFRRFHSDGTVARVDIGLRLQLSSPIPAAHAADGWRLLRDVLLCSVQVRNAKGLPATVPLIGAGDLLAQHYLAATTQRKASPPIQTQAWWLSAGTPVLIVEYPRDNAPPVLPPHTQTVLHVPEADATLSHAKIKIGTNPCSLWFIAHGQGDPDAVRRLRIHLSRLHAERECLTRVLIHLNDEAKFDLANHPQRSDAVQQYLNDALRVLQRPDRFGLPQAVLLDAARMALGVALEGQSASLSQTRRQVAAKVEGYLRREQRTATIINNIQGDVMNTTIQLGNVSVTGDFNLVTAHNIQNSFNKVANAKLDPELESRLQAVAIEVAKLVKHLPEDTAEKTSRDLETLTNEATSKAPRKEWYQLSAKGLVEAAKSVAEMAAPVATAVTALLALLP